MPIGRDVNVFLYGLPSSTMGPEPRNKWLDVRQVNESVEVGCVAKCQLVLNHFPQNPSAGLPLTCSQKKANIKAQRVKNHKTDREDARLLLKPLREDRFPAAFQGLLGF